MNIIQYWHDDNPPAEVHERVASVRFQNTRHSHTLFDEGTACRFIRDHFTVREEAAFLACAVPAMKCDYFRLCALLVAGGVYIDADFLCLQSLQPLIEGPGAARLFQRPNGHVPNGLMIARRPGNPLLRFALEIATLNIEQRLLTHVWAATGPGILTTFYGLLRLGGLEGFLASLAERPEWTRPFLRQLAPMILERAEGQLHALACHASLTPWQQVDSFLTEEPQPLYKKELQYWANWKGSIYC